MTGDAERIIALYERHAHAWDRARSHAGRPLEAPWLDRFSSYLPKAGSVLDLGCGAAEPMARYLIGLGYKLTGVDSSSTLISLSRTRFPEHEWLIADMRKLSLELRFDGLLAWDSFFHLSPTDQRSMFPIFNKHAAEGAVLMFTSGTAYGEIAGEFQGEPLYHASLDPTEYRRLISDNGFEVLAHVAEDPGCGQHTIWLARRTAPA